MKFGICASTDSAEIAKKQGWDYLECNAQTVLQGLVPEEQWTQREAIDQSVLPILACNSMVPASLKITGPDVDSDALARYMHNILRRAGKVGIQTLVFGSAGARNVPDGFDRQTAHRQIQDFIRMFSAVAVVHDVTVVAEPLNKGESNILNFVAEAMDDVKALEHPGYQCLVDSYHFWKEAEPLEHLRDAMPWIKHVHVADLAGRVAPGKSGTSNYQPFFRTLKEGGYDLAISVECSGLNLAEDGARTLEFLHTQWDRA